MKFCLFLLLSVFSCFYGFAQTTGKGCNIGDNVATNYLGQATYYGNTSVIVQVYSNTNIVNIARGQGYAGYRCGSINVYSGGTKNGSPYPGVNEVLHDYNNVSSNKCVVVSSYSPDVTSTNGEGYELDYSYNNPAYYANSDPNYPCNTPTNNVPLDQNMIYILLLSGISGFLVVRNMSAA